MWEGSEVKDSPTKRIWEADRIENRMLTKNGKHERQEWYQIHKWKQVLNFLRIQRTAEKPKKKKKKKRKDVLSPLKKINWINKLFYEGDYFVLIFLIYSRVSNTCHTCHRQAIIHKPFLAASLLENTMNEWEISEICLLYSRTFNSSNHT